MLLGGTAVRHIRHRHVSPLWTAPRRWDRRGGPFFAHLRARAVARLNGVSLPRVSIPDHLFLATQHSPERRSPWRRAAVVGDPCHHEGRSVRWASLAHEATLDPDRPPDGDRAHTSTGSVDAKNVAGAPFQRVRIADVSEGRNADRAPRVPQGPHRGRMVPATPRTRTAEEPLKNDR